ncbi:hypothetical protein DL765_004536 [Monosporascus sp. GIB2]|nr:hypothetical protein DL765_004536 [Monosporascus sp. GIB2]
MRRNAWIGVLRNRVYTAWKGLGEDGISWGLRNGGKVEAGGCPYSAAGRLQLGSPLAICLRTGFVKRFPSGEKATEKTESPWPASVDRHAPVAASQTLTMRSPEPDASRLPSAEKATELTQLRWPSSVDRHAPVAASQTLTVRSQEPDASRLPSAEKATEVTESLWPASVDRHAPVAASQTLTMR